MAATVRQRGLLYDQAAEYARALEAGDEAASLTMLNAWSDGYWGVRRELDQFWAKVAAARAAGERTSPAWAFQQRRLQQVLDETSRQMARYSQAAALVTEQRQRAAIQEGLAHAEGLATTVIQEGLPGLEGTLGRTNPAVLEAGVGFLADGSVLRNHLAKTLPGPTVDGLRDVLVHGLATGKGQDWMIRQATRTLGLAHGRATTILRTESLRAYRAASRDTYLANADVLGGWVWNAHLDARTCVACVLMDGTEHPLDATLDGHPRCRCAMVPRTRSWEDILGPDGADLPDTRPPVRSGKAWLEAQPPTTQRAIMGRAKFTAWQEGHITLDDMVARSSHPDWGTMRTERSLKAITEGRDANWTDADTVAHPPVETVVRGATGTPERANPFTGQDLADALSPTRKRTKAAILKDLEATPEGKDLAAQIKAFTETRGGVANLRKNLTATMEGNASPAVQAKTQAFLDALDAYPTAEVPELFRGMAVKVEADTAEWWDAFEGQFQPGQVIDLNATSFSSSEKKAAEFSGMIGGTRKATSNYTAVRFYLEEGAHALPVEALSKFKAEREWITGGRFEVVEFSRGTAAQPYTKVVIRQVKGLGQ